MLKIVRPDQTAPAAEANGNALAVSDSNLTQLRAASGGAVARSGSEASTALQSLQEEEDRVGARPSGRRPFFGVRNLFLICVALPTALAAIYMFGVASDQYRTEARFVIKSAQKSASTGIGALLESTGLTAATGDTHAVIDFLTSRGALEQLSEKVPFKDMMARSDADFLARYPGIAFEDNFEALYDHYGRKVEVVLDSTSGIVTTSVLGFTPQDALRISEGLLDVGEDFIGKLNASSFDDALVLAQASVTRAEARSSEAQQALTLFRIQNQIVDPTIDVKRLSGLTEGLTGELLKIDQRIAALRTSAPQSPQLNILQRQRATLAGQIGDQNEELSGDSGAADLPEVIAKFTELQLEAEFAAKALEASNISFEKARQEVLRKQLYLTRIVEPRRADDARDPARLEMVAIVFALLASAFLILWLLTANLREHAE